jgi:hypothetical protein
VKGFFLRPRDELRRHCPGDSGRGSVRHPALTDIFKVTFGYKREHVGLAAVVVVVIPLMFMNCFAGNLESLPLW